MPKRNGQNPIRSSKGSNQPTSKGSNASNGFSKSIDTIKCPKCEEAVAPKPGFRISSLKCPKCGSSLGK